MRKILRAAKAQGIALADGLGVRTPVVNESQITFNGSTAKDEDYETFEILPYENGGFVKTAQRPYDAVVGAVLLRLAVLNPEFVVKSDGNWADDWTDARKLYESLFGPAQNILS